MRSLAGETGEAILGAAGAVFLSILFLSLLFLSGCVTGSLRCDCNGVTSRYMVPRALPAAALGVVYSLCNGVTVVARTVAWRAV